MAQKTRSDLGMIFDSGSTPTKLDFADLFDSFLNFKDDSMVITSDKIEDGAVDYNKLSEDVKGKFGGRWTHVFGDVSSSTDDGIPIKIEFQPKFIIATGYIYYNINGFEDSKKHVFYPSFGFANNQDQLCLKSITDHTDENIDINMSTRTYANHEYLYTKAGFQKKDNYLLSSSLLWPSTVPLGPISTISFDIKIEIGGSDSFLNAKMSNKGTVPSDIHPYFYYSLWISG